MNGVFIALVYNVKIGAARRNVYVLRPQITAIAETYLYYIARSICGYLFAALIIKVYNALSAYVKQLRLCCKVVFHSLMEIKMITRQICEHTYIKVTAVYSFKLQSVARNLHNNAVRAALLHFRKKLLELKRVRSGRGCALSDKHFIAYNILICADNAYSKTRLLDYTSDQVGYCCLSVCSRYAYQLKFL